MLKIADLNYYELLEVSRDAVSSVIKRAYRKMAEDYHPDKTMHLGKRLRELAELEMKRINKAKEVLMDEEKRRWYNEYLDGKRTEDLDDIVMDVDPFQGFEEANWEELKEEILEVEPLEDTTEVAEAEVVPDVKVQSWDHTTEAAPKPERSAPTKLPFWKRVKSKVVSYDTFRSEQKNPRRRSGSYDRDWKNGYEKFSQDSRVQQTVQPEFHKEPVITPPPPPPPPPPHPVPQPQYAAHAARRKEKSPSKKRRKPHKKPTEEDIKINVIKEFDDEQPEWDDHGYDYDYDYEVSDNPEYKDSDDPKIKVYDFEQVDPIQMEIVDEKDHVDIQKLHHKKHKSRLEGLEPKDDYEVKWTENKKGERYRRKKKTDDLEDWERHKKRAEEQRDKRIGSKRVGEGERKREPSGARGPGPGARSTPHPKVSSRVGEGESKRGREGERKREPSGARDPGLEARSAPHPKVSSRVGEVERKKPEKKKKEEEEAEFDEWM